MTPRTACGECNICLTLTSFRPREKARSRAPTLVGRYDLKAAEKATEALFAQLAGGAPDPKPKARSKTDITKQRAFNNVGPFK